MKYDFEVTIRTTDGKTYKFTSQSEAIRKAREAAGLSQEQAAKAVGIKVQAWQKYEYGDRVPKMNMLEKIAKALNTSIEVLTAFRLVDPADAEEDLGGFKGKGDTPKENNAQTAENTQAAGEADNSTKANNTTETNKAGDTNNAGGTTAAGDTKENGEAKGEV
jgi:transcriptional regulator with XRE-family HTH domain